MLGQWCAAGLAYERFWPLTFAEIEIILRGEYKKQLRDHDEARVRNYELAQWISYAHHNPSKMPKFSTSYQDDKAKSDAVAQERVRGWFVAMALSSAKR